MGFFNSRLSAATNSPTLTPVPVDNSVQLQLQLRHAEELAAVQQQLTAMQARVLDSDARLEAISKSQTVLELALDGTILAANNNFLKVLEYSLEEIRGKNFIMLGDATLANSPLYEKFWLKLKRGEFVADVFRYVSKSGGEIWMRGSFNPVIGSSGNVESVIGTATDITIHRQRNNDTAGQLKALNKTMSVIECNLDGSILHANDNFLALSGYSLPAIQGQHHRMLVPESVRDSERYREFWAKLNRGEYESGEYRLISKEHATLWIHGSWNPIFDANGRLYKVVQFASDISSQKKLQDMITLVMQDTTRVMGSLSAGKLHDKMNGQYAGEFVQLAGAVNGYIDRLYAMVGEIKDSAEAVKQGAHEISSGNSHLSQRTEEQAATLEETSAAMEEMMTTVQQNAANADQATVLAQGAKAAAEKGGDIVRKAVVAMQAINVASSKINDIIGVIDEIAFQTNLLALNAAVEAARAGDQGRGFAVVADEVRNLAGRSATAAKEIKGLIKDSYEKVKEGTTLVNNSGQTLEEIVASVKKV
ncbi:MAG: methyl-accepting chemotaxis protein, partial [Pseudomonadota bacterium]